ncbi:MAG: 3-oxoacyl-ACP synthase, partial [Verrucomicrobia bacterium]|nr:3-oxoacyl-ACP synthase [Verrucomicrobiota bacterium]
MNLTMRKTATAFKNPRAQHDFVGHTCSITGVGSYVPERILTNADLEKIVETTDEWITTRTGIKERRIAAADEFTSDMAAKAAARAMQMAGVTAEQIDLIIVATITPDMPFPSTACLVQQKLGALRAAAFDIEAACSGFIYALEIGQQFIMSRTHQTVLVVDADLRNPNVGWFFGLDVDKGLLDYLSEDTPLGQILVNPGFQRLVVLPGKGSTTHSSELLSSPKMIALVNDLKSKYDSRIILFDMPPLLAL